MILTKEFIQANNKIPGFTPLEDHIRLNELLHEFDKPGCVGVELGSLHGRSAWTISKTIPNGHLYCIDTWNGFDSHFNLHSEEECIESHYPLKGTFNTQSFFIENISDCKNIIIIKGQSPYDIINWNIPVDFVFNDADHENPVDRLNIDFWWKWIKPGGLLMGHDYNPGKDIKPEYIFQDIRDNVSYLENKLNQKVMFKGGSCIYAFRK
jgi:hypothetical protein